MPVGPSAVAPCTLLDGLQRAPAELLAAERLGWAPLELASVPQVALPQRLHSVLAGCPGLDHSVRGVASTLGGSAAGYARWEAFRRRGLPLYAARRNDAMQRNDVSRLSAYHHLGMVSPFKVAREAALERGPGGTKFLGGCGCVWLARGGLDSAAGLSVWTQPLGAWFALLAASVAHPPSHLQSRPPDEFLIWREIGFNLCLHRHHDLHSLAALPK